MISVIFLLKVKIFLTLYRPFAYDDAAAVFAVIIDKTNLKYFRTVTDIWPAWAKDQLKLTSYEGTCTVSSK